MLWQWYHRLNTIFTLWWYVCVFPKREVTTLVTILFLSASVLRILYLHFISVLIAVFYNYFSDIVLEFYITSNVHFKLTLIYCYITTHYCYTKLVYIFRV